LKRAARTATLAAKQTTALSSKTTEEATLPSKVTVTATVKI
jgi:hypothetical protein